MLLTIMETIQAYTKDIYIFKKKKERNNNKILHSSYTYHKRERER